MMKRGLVFSGLLILLVSFASAQYYGGGFWYGTERFIDSLVRNIAPLLQALFGGQDWTGYLLFEKLLLFLLITIIVGLVLENLPVFKDRVKKGILRLVAVIIGVLGVRGLNFAWINTILVQYQVLFIAVAGILPFMIYWAFLKDFTSGVKKIAWSLYGVIYLGLWITNDLEAYESVYLWGAIVAFVYGFFIDKSIQKYLDEQKTKAARVRSIWLAISENNELIRKLYLRMQNETEGSKLYNSLKDQARDLNKRNLDLERQAS